jgi:hypothetical protein
MRFPDFAGPVPQSSCTVRSKFLERGKVFDARFTCTGNRKFCEQGPPHRVGPDRQAERL